MSVAAVHSLLQAFGYPKKLRPNEEVDDHERSQLQVLADGTILRPQVPGEADKGSWFIMTLTTFVSLVIASLLYNMMVANDTSAPQLTGKLPMVRRTHF